MKLVSDDSGDTDTCSVLQYVQLEDAILPCVGLGSLYLFDSISSSTIKYLCLSC